MTLTLTKPTLKPAKLDREKMAVIDGDIHTAPASPEVLRKYLPVQWQRHMDTFGTRRTFSGGYYPRLHPSAARDDAWPPNGGPPGSDLAFLQSQLLDSWDIEVGIMNPLYPVAGQTNIEYGAALASAVNDWQVAEWLEPEPRLRGSIIVPVEDGQLSAAEIDRCAAESRFVQILLVIRTREPLGRRKYWPMFEAACRHDLPVGIHFGGNGGWPITGAGWPSYYIEDHVGMPQSFQSQISSLIFEGVFEQFPQLKIVLIEGGFGWLPPLMWRLDRSWQEMQAEVPHVKHLPSETIRDRFWITTQPIEEPPQPVYFDQLLEQLDMNDRLIFATDYPHWDFDAPDRALPATLSKELKRNILAENARAFYRF